MFNLERTRATSQHLDASGGEYTLVSERIVVSLQGKLGWSGAAYTHPVAVVRDGRSRQIFDVVMMVRLAALLTVTLAAIVGTLRR